MAEPGGDETVKMTGLGRRFGQAVTLVREKKLLTVVEKLFPEEGRYTGTLFRPNFFLDFSREGRITGQTPGLSVAVWPCK